MNRILAPVENPVEENQRLLKELEAAYTNMELILEKCTREKQIAYQELQQKVDILQQLYDELSNKENMLIHLEKLSSIGQFISEIIHELNSPLVAISAHAELALMMNPSGELQEEIQQISKQVMRTSEYLNRFKGMVYKGSEDFGLFDLNQNLADCLATIEIIKPNEVEIVTCLCDAPLVIQGDPYQTDQIFLNLAKNAFDALQDHGTFLRATTKRVSTEWINTTDEIGRTTCRDDTTWQQVLKESKHFALAEFADDGPGIPPEILKHIFLPFYTTKKRGKGTGLGLSIASDIAKRHHGNLTVKSVLGKGAAFQLLIPLAADLL